MMRYLKFILQKTEIKILTSRPTWNNYFTKIFSNYVPELNFSDRFISWGTKKIIIFCAFNFKSLKNKGSLKKES